MADGQIIIDRFSKSVTTSSATTTEILEVTFPINYTGTINSIIIMKPTNNNDSLTFNQDIMIGTNGSGLVVLDKGPITIRGTTSLLASGWFTSVTPKTSTTISMNVISGTSQTTVWSITMTMPRLETTITG